MPQPHLLAMGALHPQVSLEHQHYVLPHSSQIRGGKFCAGSITVPVTPTPSVTSPITASAARQLPKDSTASARGSEGRRGHDASHAKRELQFAVAGTFRGGTASSAQRGGQQFKDMHASVVLKRQSSRPSCASGRPRQVPCHAFAGAIEEAQVTLLAAAEVVGQS